MGSIQNIHNRIENTSSRIDETVVNILKNSNKCVKNVMGNVVSDIKDKLDITRKSDDPLAFSRFENKVYDSLDILHKLCLKTKRVCGSLSLEDKSYEDEYIALCDIIKVLGSIIIEQKVSKVNNDGIDIVQYLECLYSFDYNTYLVSEWNKAVENMLKKLNLDIKREKFEEYRDAREAEKEAAINEAGKHHQVDETPKDVQETYEEVEQTIEEVEVSDTSKEDEIEQSIDNEDTNEKLSTQQDTKTVTKYAEEKLKETKNNIMMVVDVSEHNSDESIKANFRNAGPVVYIEPTCTAYELNKEEQKKLEGALRRKGIAQGLARVCNVHNPVEVVKASKKISMDLVNSLIRYDERPLYKVDKQLEKIYSMLDENSKHLLNSFQLTPFGIINKIAYFDDQGIDILTIILKETLTEHLSNEGRLGIIQNNLDITPELGEFNIWNTFYSEVTLVKEWVETAPIRVNKKELIEKAIKSLYTTICTFDVYRTRMYILLAKLYTQRHMRYALSTDVYFIHDFINEFYKKEYQIKQNINYKDTINKVIDTINFAMAQSLVILVQLQNYLDNYINRVDQKYILYADFLDIRIREQVLSTVSNVEIDRFNLNSLDDFVELLDNLKDINIDYIKHVVQDAFGTSLSKEEGLHDLLLEYRKPTYNNEYSYTSAFSTKVGFPRVKMIPDKFVQLKLKEDCKKQKDKKENIEEKQAVVEEKQQNIVGQQKNSNNTPAYSKDDIRIYKSYVSEYIKLYEDITGIRCNIDKRKLNNPTEDGLMSVKTGRLTDSVLSRELGLRKTIDVIREKVGYTGLELRVSSYDTLRCLFGEDLDYILNNTNVSVLLTLLDSLCIIKEYYGNGNNVFQCAVNLLVTSYRASSDTKVVKNNIRDIAALALDKTENRKYSLEDIISLNDYMQEMSKIIDPFTGMTYEQEICELSKLDEYKGQSSISTALKIGLHKYVKPNVSMNLYSMIANGIIDNPAKCLLIDPSKSRQITIWLNNSACITQKPKDLDKFTLNLNSKILEFK